MTEEEEIEDAKTRHPSSIPVSKEDCLEMLDNALLWLNTVQDMYAPKDTLLEDVLSSTRGNIQDIICKIQEGNWEIKE